MVKGPVLFPEPAILLSSDKEPSALAVTNRRVRKMLFSEMLTSIILANQILATIHYDLRWSKRPLALSPRL